MIVPPFMSYSLVAEQSGAGRLHGLPTSETECFGLAVATNETTELCYFEVVQLDSVSISILLQR